MPLDAGIAALLQLIENAGYPPMSESDPATARKGFRAMTVDLVAPGTQVPVGSVEPATAGDRPARVYRPATTGPHATVVFFHGGGFVIGDLDTHDQTCRRLCSDADVVVVSVDYRLAPENRFPAAVDDAIAATRWAAAHLGELGGNDVLAVGGDSAGGNLSAVSAQELRDVVKAQLLIYPATHVLADNASRTDNATGYFLDQPTMEWFMTHYVSEGDDFDDPRLSPQLGDVSGVGPALVVTAEFDPLRDEGEAYADKLEAAGVNVERVRYDGLIHGFIDMGLMSPAAADAVSDINAKFKDLLGTL